MTYQRILIPVDGSKVSEYAFQKGVDIAKRNNAALTLAHVVDIRTYANVESDRGSLHENADKYTEKMLNGYKDIALQSGVKSVDTVIGHGAARQVITKEIAPKSECDLIICGSNGINALERFIMGSVSEAIVRYAKCDVLVVRSELVPEDFKVASFTEEFRREYNSN
ncbi:universal stress protein [Macrococcoides caseolyticum]|uniref:universal stress protein n=1 Tax=Macrococcoides caseolyticum TaxID=69966 RepID=UPI001F277955|nr:universal stress protein [Macrococcus caseolyticus]MCE4957540.1 universal stress protein [Macrococcus caseolyticus]